MTVLPGKASDCPQAEDNVQIKIKTIGFIFLLIFISDVQAKKPHWIENVPKKVGYKFYVGRSSGYDEQEAVQKATQDAYNQAIREDFGIKTKIDIQATETMQSVHYEKNFSEKSQNIQLIGFKREKIHVQKREDIFRVWGLFKYSLREMRKERKRIKKFVKLQELKEKGYALGKLEYEKGNRVKARAQWKKSCDAGNLNACNKLVELKHEDKQKNKELLLERGNYFRKSCMRGNVKRCSHLGSLNEQAGNYVEAAEWFGKACHGTFSKKVDESSCTKYEQIYTKECENGNVSVCCTLMKAISTSVNVPKSIDIANAVKLCEEACKSGHTQSCDQIRSSKNKNVGFFSGKSMFFSKGTNRFFSGYSLTGYLEDKRSCTKGNAKKCYKIGTFEDERGNAKKATTFYKKACSNGLMGACNVLVQKNQTEISYLSKKEKFFEKACEKRDVLGCYNLGFLKRKMGNHNKAKKLFKKSCYGGWKKSCVAENIKTYDHVDPLYKEYYEMDCPRGRIHRGSSRSGFIDHDNFCNSSMYSVVSMSAKKKRWFVEEMIQSLIRNEESELRYYCEVEQNMFACYNLALFIVGKEEKLKHERNSVYREVSSDHPDKACWRLKKIIFRGHWWSRNAAQKEYEKYLKKACDGGFEKACHRISGWGELCYHVINPSKFDGGEIYVDDRQRSLEEVKNFFKGLKNELEKSK